MGGESGKRRGEMRLAATRAGNRIAIPHQLLEFGSAIFTNVFKYGHFRSPSSFCSILAEELGALGKLETCPRFRRLAKMVAGNEVSAQQGLDRPCGVLVRGNSKPATTFAEPAGT
jgi:hypothetical protein